MLTKLQLRSVSSSEVDLKGWNPKSLEEIFISLDLEIGPADDDGINLFYVTLATPEALRKYRSGPILVEHRTIVIERYNYEDVLKGLNDIVRKCERNTWDECCAVLQRFFQWEYEDYSTDRG